MSSMTGALSLQQWLHSLLLACGSEGGQSWGQEGGYRLRWARPQARPAYIGDPCQGLSLTERLTLAQTVITRWSHLDLPSAYPFVPQLRAHTHLHLLPSGQLVLTPDAIALVAWLTWFSLSQGLTPWPALPCPHLTLPPTSLAPRLQLSAWMAVQYIQSRCHHLARLIELEVDDKPGPPTPEQVTDRLAQFIPQTQAGQRVLVDIVALVDHLAEPGGGDQASRFSLAYHLAEGVETWLSQITLAHPPGELALLLRAVDYSLSLVTGSPAQQL
ncbi:MAG: hypothetical protein KGQ93_10035 [Cyanobacteria bacterium REEB459]|nr:hypothetical protein [Cyanobacteria bacterium REEB459]